LESDGGMIYWQGKTEELGEKPVPVPLYPPQIPHGLTQARTRASAVRSRRLTTWAMAWPLLQCWWYCCLCCRRWAALRVSGISSSQGGEYEEWLVFWDVAPCSLIDTDRRFRGAYCLHHQGSRSKNLNYIFASRSWNDYYDCAISVHNK
jgi:hypothetical protein